MTNGLFHPYHWDESIFNFRDIRSPFSFHFSIKFMGANRIAPDGTPHFAESYLGLFCLVMSHKKDVSLICVKQSRYTSYAFHYFYSSPMVSQIRSKNDQELMQSEPKVLPSKPKWEITKITNRHNTKRTYGKPN